MIAILVLATAGCSNNSDSSDENADEAVVQMEDLTEAEKAALLAAEPLARALAARDYGAVFDQLSTKAHARMSLNQFAPAEEDAEFDRYEANAESNVTRDRFIALMARTEAAFGRPAELINLHVHSSDPSELFLKPESDGVDQMGVMLAVGNMPAAIPANIRRASIRGQIKVALTAEDLAKAAAAYGKTPEDLAADPDFEPYMNFKLVVIDDAGTLKVAYFEFLPASMMD